MTPISHSFFGFTTGFILSPITAKLGVSRRRTVALCTLGSVIPDIDSISLVLNRQIYYGKEWYSHHALSHSIFGALLTAFVVMLIIQPMLTLQMFKRKPAVKTWTVSLTLLFIGCLIHLPCDMITKPGTWAGIPLFAPFSWSRFGGWEHIPWKDYYLIYMSIGTYLVFVSIWIIEFLLKKRTLVLPVLSILILSWAVYHINTSKWVDDSQWEREQRRLVGKSLYSFADNTARSINKLWHIKPLF